LFSTIETVGVTNDEEESHGQAIGETSRNLIRAALEVGYTSPSHPRSSFDV
jgi:hypothetical protein